MTYLNGIVHSHRKSEKVFFFFDNQRCLMCAPRVTQHTSIRYPSSCQTRVNMSASIVFTAAMIRAFRSARSRRRVLCVLCTKCTLHSNHRLTRVLFQHTKRLLPRSGHFFSLHTLASPSGRNMNCDKKKTTYGGKIFLSCFFYLYMFCKYVYCGFPITNFCNPGVLYETPCI